MKIDTKVLKDALGRVGYAIATKPDNPILGCVLFTLKKNTLTLTGFNLVIGVTTTLEVDSDETYNIGVPYKLLKDILANLSGELFIEYVENQLTIIASDGNFTIVTLYGNEYPELIATDEIKDDYHKLDWQDIAPNLKLVNGATSSDSGKQILTGVCVNGTTDKNAVYNELAATDSHILIITKVISTIPDQLSVISSAIIEAALLAFKKEEEVYFTVVGTKAVFKTDTTRLAGFTVTGRYPPYNKLIPDNFKYSLEVDNVALARALTILNPIQEENNCKINLTHTNDTLHLKSTAKGIGAGYASVPCPGDNPDINLNFQLKYLDGALKAFKEPTTININENNTPVVLMNDFIKYLIMPMM